MQHHNAQLQAIAQKVAKAHRIDESEALLLYQQADLALLAQLATLVCERSNGRNVLYNRNFHIEPTNCCRYNCQFCSYHKSVNDPQQWTLSLDDIAQIARRYKGSDVTEAHIVGGVHPDWDWITIVPLCVLCAMSCPMCISRLFRRWSCTTC